MAISYVGGRTGNASGSTTTDITVAINSGLTGGTGTGVSTGDLVVVTVSLAHSDDAPTADLVTADYTALTQLDADNTRDCALQVHYKFMGATPDTSVVIARSGNIENSIAYTVQVFAGVDATTPMDVTPVTATGTGTGLADPGPITPVTAGAWIVICAGNNNSGTELFTWSADFEDTLSSHASDTQDATVGSAYYSGWTSSEYNPAATTTGGTLTSASWCAYTLALRPAGAAAASLTAVASFTLGAATLAAVAASTVEAAGSFTLGAATLASSGWAEGFAAASITLGAATLSAVAASTIEAAAAITLGAATLVATAEGAVDTIEAQAAITLGAATLVAEATSTIEAAAAITLGAATLAAEADTTVHVPEAAAADESAGSAHGQRRKFKIPDREPKEFSLDDLYGEPPVVAPAAADLTHKVVMTPVTFGQALSVNPPVPFAAPAPVRIKVAEPEDDFDDIVSLVVALF